MINWVVTCQIQRVDVFYDGDWISVYEVPNFVGLLGLPSKMSKFTLKQIRKPALSSGLEVWKIYSLISSMPSAQKGGG